MGRTKGGHFQRGMFEGLPVFIVVVGENGDVKDVFTGTEDDVVALASLKRPSETESPLSGRETLKMFGKGGEG